MWHLSPSSFNYLLIAALTSMLSGGSAVAPDPTIDSRIDLEAFSPDIGQSANSQRQTDEHSARRPITEMTTVTVTAAPTTLATSPETSPADANSTPGEFDKESTPSTTEATPTATTTTAPTTPTPIDTPTTTGMTTTSTTTTAPTTTTSAPTTSTTTTTTTSATTSSAVAECLSRPSLTVLAGDYTDRVRISSPVDDHTVDARSGTSLTSGERALEIGSSRVSDGACIIGWSAFGQQSRTLTWRQMHDDLGGSALRVYGSNYLVDGLRAENVEDAFDPRGGEGFEVRNMWTEYIRDDCIENDERRAGIVVDSLFDGCYTFFSEQEEGNVAGESLIFERVLVRLQPMPAPHGTDDPAVLGHGSFFKRFDRGGRHQPIIRDSVFFLEQDCYSGCKDWPPGTVASNVAIVWVGDGEFPMSVLPGMTLTNDRSVWDAAVANWKQRHGCTTIDQPCTRLHNPT